MAWWKACDGAGGRGGRWGEACEKKTEGKGQHLGVCLVSHRKLNVPLLIALIAAGAQVLAAIIHRL